MTLLFSLFLVLSAAGVFAMYNRGAFKNLQIPNAIASYLPTAKSITSVTDMVAQIKPTANQSQELTTLATRTQESSQAFGKVLGDFVQVNEADTEKPLQEKALEYGQYIYCKQVVETYQKAYPQL